MQLSLTADLISEEIFKLIARKDNEPKKKKVKRLVALRLHCTHAKLIDLCAFYDTILLIMILNSVDLSLKQHPRFVLKIKRGCVAWEPILLANMDLILKVIPLQLFLITLVTEIPGECRNIQSCYADFAPTNLTSLFQPPQNDDYPQNWVPRLKRLTWEGLPWK